MNYGASMMTKESIIEEYISKVNFNDPKFNVNNLKRTLATLLHEEPGVKLNWRNDKTVNEVSGKETTVEKIASIVIFYTVTDAEGKLAPKSLTYYA